MPIQPSLSLKYLLIVSFVFSGFSGLIYESIWTHYLKLFLGHAAYAQTLVLCIFMGGMAVGAGLASRYSARWKNLILLYAAVEGLIGVAALIFHGSFVQITDWVHFQILPLLGSTESAHLIKWSLAGLLILPQSILLGATFPLMSAGLIRLFPGTPGRSLATLYFSNSLGAAVGALISGFILISWVGLPGTIMTAGLINIFIALFMWALTKLISVPPYLSPTLAAPATSASPTRLDFPVYRFLLLVALLTGAASFLYEVAWIRMLSLVLGSSTHAFELMLSAFIFGLALGGFWIRKRIEFLVSPQYFLGKVQIAMGVLALGTLFVYGYSFDWMQLVLQTFNKNSAGYTGFNFASHLIALAIMIPATFCAGMTLPILTAILLKKGPGEKSIGAVYAANTMGAILGVVVAVHFALPILGLKGTIVLGAGIDIGLGIWLLSGPLGSRSKKEVVLFNALGLAAFVLVGLFLKLDTSKMASGVYRHGRSTVPPGAKVVYHQDGKTATVNLIRSPGGFVSILTNGKSDASISLSGNAAPDEVTMVIAGALPFALLPNAETAANIGLGSGLTTHTLLANPRLKKVDTIEIETKMVEAARGFGSRVSRTYTDPRSHIYVEDAKTFFSVNQSKYDIVVSEPSNPWVSGVASLFSEEFYRTIRVHINPGGLLIQWLQVYEFDVTLLGSVLKALSPHFSDYAIFNTDDTNILIVAKNGGTLGRLSEAVLTEPLMAAELRRVQIHNKDDLIARKIASKQFMDRLVSPDIPKNSDYFPYLDLHAPKARFLGTNALNLTNLGLLPLPLVEMLETDGEPLATSVSKTSYWKKAEVIRQAVAVHADLSGASASAAAALYPDLVILRNSALRCGNALEQGVWLNSLYRIATSIIPVLPPHNFNSIANPGAQHNCSQESVVLRSWLLLFEALTKRDSQTIAGLSEEMLQFKLEVPANRERYAYLISAAMLGYLAQDQKGEALRVAELYVPKLRMTVNSLPQHLQLLLAWINNQRRQ